MEYTFSIPTLSIDQLASLSPKKGNWTGVELVVFTTKQPHQAEMKTLSSDRRAFAVTRWNGDIGKISCVRQWICRPISECATIWPTKRATANWSSRRCHRSCSCWSPPSPSPPATCNQQHATSICWRCTCRDFTSVFFSAVTAAIRLLFARCLLFNVLYFRLVNC